MLDGTRLLGVHYGDAGDLGPSWQAQRYPDEEDEKAHRWVANVSIQPRAAGGASAAMLGWTASAWAISAFATQPRLRCSRRWAAYSPLATIALSMEVWA